MDTYSLIKFLHVAFVVIWLGGGFCLVVLGARDLDLLIESGNRRFGFLQGKFVIRGINFKHHVARIHCLVVLNVDLDNLASHTRRNAYNVCSRDRIICPRMVLDDSPNPEDQHDCSRYH